MGTDGEFTRKIAPDVTLGAGVKVCDFVNLYGCAIGDGSKIGTFVEVQKGAAIGRNCKISSHTFVCEGVTIEDEVFVGHGVTFTNDRFPRATRADGKLQTEADWVCERTLVKRGASIGSGATILCGVAIGERAIVGAGSVVTRSVPPDAVVAGNPARVLRSLRTRGGTMDSNANVPFLDLKAQYAAIREEIDRAIAQVLESAAFAGGPFVAQFEKEFAAFCGTAHAIGVASGTDALWFSLLALDIGPGDEVITVPATFMATAEAICVCGAKPVFVDIDARTCTMDPQRFAGAITPRTKAVIPVHLYGQTADIDPILAIAREHGVAVIEDACQAHGALYRGRPAGSFGDAGCFSFYPGKNLGAYGEGGAVVTNSPSLAERIARLREHGQPRKYYHTEIGWNGRMDGIQGAILSVKLKHLPAWNEARRAHARRYAELLGDVEGIATPYEAPAAKHVYHVYAIRSPERDELMKALGARGIQCGIHYPVPLHLQEAFRPAGLGPGSFPVAERWAQETLSLPMFPELTDQQIERTAAEVKRCAVATAVSNSR